MRERERERRKRERERKRKKKEMRKKSDNKVKMRCEMCQRGKRHEDGKEGKREVGIDGNER